MSQESEQAQEAWIARADKVSAITHSGDYLQGHDELKAALKAEIENLVNDLEYLKKVNKLSEAGWAKINAYKRVLSLLDTVKPNP